MFKAVIDILQFRVFTVEKKKLFSIKYWYDGMPHTHTHKNQTFGISSSFDDSDRL